MSIPSLRQQMINEALDYHMNMNHVVFNRERKHVETMGQQVLDKKQSDIIIEGNIRDRISRIMTAIQKLVQGVDFAVSDPTKTPTATATATASNVSQPSVTGLRTSMGTQTEPELQSGVDKTTVAGSPLRSKKYINDAIASILSEYNSLCDYIDLQGRQKPFSQSDISGIDALVKQLVDPMKSAIASLSGLFGDKEKIEEYIEYTRLFNVITAIISNINIGFPFQKVSVSLLTDKVPLKKDLIEAASFDPYEKGNYDYMDTIYKQLQKEQEKLNKLPQHSQDEKDAYMLASKAYDQQRQRLSDAGYLSKEQYINTALRQPIMNDFYGFAYQTRAVSAQILVDFQDLEDNNPFKNMLIPDILQTIKNIVSDYDTRLNTTLEAIPKNYKRLPPAAIDEIYNYTRQLLQSRYRVLSKLIEAVNQLNIIPSKITMENLKREGIDTTFELPSYISTKEMFDISKERSKVVDIGKTKSILKQPTTSRIPPYEYFMADQAYKEQSKLRRRDILAEEERERRERKEQERIARSEQQVLKRTEQMGQQAAKRLSRAELRAQEGERGTVMEPLYEFLTTDDKKERLIDYILRNAPRTFMYPASAGNPVMNIFSADGSINPMAETFMFNRTVRQLTNDLKDILGGDQATAERIRKQLIGEGKKKGGNVHKTEVFDDQEELEPYLTKHLIPSKYRKNVPPIESSSEESSGEEGDGSDMEINELRLGKGRKKKGTRKQRKQMQDMKAISKLPVVEATVLIEKKRGGAKKLLAPIHKPVIKDSGADKDLWFL